MMRVLVCGGRDYSDIERFTQEMCNLLWRSNRFADLPKDYEPVEIIHGDAPGADTLAKQFAASCGLVQHAFPADWKTYGKAAGPIRNTRMLEEGRPDIGVAFPTARSRGTYDMIRKLQGAGKKVYVIND